MKKFFLIGMLCLTGSTQNARAMGAVLPLIKVGACYGGIIPAVGGGLCCLYNKSKPTDQFAGQWGYFTIGGALLGGGGGLLSHAITRTLFANPVLYAMSGATCAGALAGCGALVMWYMKNWNVIGR